MRLSSSSSFSIPSIESGMTNGVDKYGPGFSPGGRNTLERLGERPVWMTRSQHHERKKSFLKQKQHHHHHHHLHQHNRSSSRANLTTALPLPKLGLSSSWFGAGVRICGNAKTNHYLHLIWGLVYALAGAVQFVAGIYFMLELPIFQLGSNIWTGAWNIFSAIVTIFVLCSSGGLSVLKAQCLLLMSLVVVVVNLINLVILEVGEWRGFLTVDDRTYIQQNGLDVLMHDAYMSTTISTVVAMIASFFASQQTFCYLQLHGETDSIIDGIKSRTFTPLDADDFVVKRHQHINNNNNDDSGLNLKTPGGATESGPQPHPSWVYRNNYAPFNPNRSPVKRSLSVLSSQLKLPSRSQFDPSSRKSFSPLKESNLETTTTSSTNRYQKHHHEQLPSKMRHAVIRRHQSMYIHPRTTSEIQATMPYKMHEVSGKSEVRPIVTLQRSKTTAGATPSSLHYKSTAILKRGGGGGGTFGLDYNHNNIYKPRHHYSNTEDLCEFQAGKSFDLPDPDKFRRRYIHNWNGGKSKPNNSNDPGNFGCVVFDAETDNASSVKGGGRSVDSCHGNIRYSAVQGLVQRSRPKTHYSSLENLLESESPNPRGMSNNLINRPHYGSTESISSLGSTQNHHQTNANNKRMVLSDDEDEENILLYDVPRKRNGSSLQKSNSRVASNGRLRLHVESFRQVKSSSGTQTDLTSVKKEPKPYTAQFKKNNSAPNKPARKTKNSSGNNNNNNNQSQSRRSSVGSNNGQDCGRSDRSDTPDNSSTSGYSSPSAGLHSSKEHSPYGSSKMMGENSDEDGNASKITVIQIVPATLDEDDEHDDEIGSSVDAVRRDILEEADVDIEEEEELPPAASAAAELRRRRLQQIRGMHRELPRIATNGTLSSSNNNNNRPPAQPQRRLPAMPGGNATNGGRMAPQPPRRAYPPMPPPPSSSSHYAAPFMSGRVPLPPVPELERSDHERESMSPAPSMERSSRPLPSPLTTPVVATARRREQQQQQQQQGQGRRIPNTPMEVDDKLKALLTLLNRGQKEPEEKEDTLQYLSQLENVARRLKDQLLMENPQVHNSRRTLNVLEEEDPRESAESNC